MSEVENQTLTKTAYGSAIGNAVSKKIKRRFEVVLSGFTDGQLSLTWPDGSTELYGAKSSDTNQNASIVFHSYAPLRRLIADGQIGFAESYMQREWSTDNLPNLFSLIMRNQDRITPATRAGKLSRLLNIWNHWTKRNSVDGSKRNIAHHYDLGNDFYQLWLDPSMSYSSAIYRSENENLSQAQQNKIIRIGELLAIEPGAKVLEVGCGWGSLASSLAKNSGAHMTGISLSKRQLEYAKKVNRVASANEAGVANSGNGLAAAAYQGSTNFQYCDYRDVKGKFDHIVSIEMFEAVGQQYWETYFNKLAALLDSGGTAVIQTITIMEDRFDAYRARPDFIQKYIFPGGMLPTKSILKQQIEKAGFSLEQTEWFGSSYAKTLAAWRDNFEGTSKDVLALNFDERFMQMWRYYLVYCETGFSIGHTDVGLLKIRKL